MGKKKYLGNLSFWFGHGVGQPVDLNLLNRFCNICLYRLELYDGLLHKTTLYAHELCGFDERRSREREITKLVVAMSAPLAPRMQYLEQSSVRWFLTELRAEWRGKPVRCKDFISTSAHELTFLVINSAAQYWRNTRRTYRNSPKPAWEHFYENYVKKYLPPSRELKILVTLEYALARKVLLKEQRESSG